MTAPSTTRLLLAGVLAPLALTACSPFEQGCVDLGDAVPTVTTPTTPTTVPVAAVPGVGLAPGTTMYADDAALDRSGERLAVRCDGYACQWDTATGDLLDAEIAGGRHLAWAGEDDDVLVGTSYDSGEEQGEVVLTEAEGADAGDRCVLLGHDIPFATDGGSGIAAMTASPDGTLLATGAGDGRVGLWSVTERERLAWLEPDLSYPSALGFSPDGATLAVGGGDGVVELWDVADRERTGELVSGLRDLAWSPDGTSIAGVSLDPSAQLVVVDVATGTASTTLGSSSDPAAAEVGGVGALAWSPDGERIGFTDLEGPAVRSWEPASGDVVEVTSHQEIPLSVLWTPDGDALYSVDGVDGVRRTPIAADESSGQTVRFETPEPIAG